LHLNSTEAELIVRIWTVLELSLLYVSEQ
jgi:hypothetical protein